MEHKPKLKHMNERILMVPFNIYEERLDKCNKCYAADKEIGTCKVNGSTFIANVRMRYAMCPMGFWSSYYGS